MLINKTVTSTERFQSDYFTIKCFSERNTCGDRYVATVSFQEEGPGCAAMGGPSIGSWGHCTIHLCTAAVTDSHITVYYPTKIDHFISYIYKEIIQTR